MRVGERDDVSVTVEVGVGDGEIVTDAVEVVVGDFVGESVGVGVIV